MELGCVGFRKGASFGWEMGQLSGWIRLERAGVPCSTTLRS